MRGERVALTICEDMWNDKNFWAAQSNGRLYSFDPVEALFQQGASLLINISGSPFSMGKPRFREQMLHAFATRYGRPVVFVNQVGGNDSLVFDGSSVALDGAGKVRVRARAFAEDLVYFDTAASGPPAAAGNELQDDDEAVLRRGARGRCRPGVAAGQCEGVDRFVVDEFEVIGIGVGLRRLGQRLTDLIEPLLHAGIVDDFHGSLHFGRGLFA